MSEQTPIVVIPEPEPIRQRLAEITQERATLRTLLRLSEKQRRREQEQPNRKQVTHDHDRD